MPWNPASLRWQLTVWHGLGLGLVLSLFVLAVYGLLAHNLYREVDRSLASRARQVERAIRANPPFLGGRPLEATVPNTFASTDIFVQVADSDGGILGRSDNLEEATLPVTQEQLEAVRAAEPKYTEVRVRGESVRVYSAPLSLPGGSPGMVQVARSLEPVQVALAQFRLLAATGLLLCMGLAALVVWYTTGAALRPLEHVIETSEDIGWSSDLGRRVRAVRSGSEVGRLARTFNRMLDRLEATDTELRDAYGRVEASLRAQRRFTADASHELRTPLTTIRGYAGLLRQFAQVTPGDRVAAVGQIELQAERMSRLVEGLLTLARADSGQRLARGERVALGPLVRDAVAQARTLAAGQSIALSIGDEAAEVEGDTDALRQLVLILLDNAVKYTPPGGSIQIRLDASDGETRITVADTGIGIAAEDLPHIFERFYRARHNRTSSKGTGLGLSIARWIAEEHGGAIGVTSSPGAGSTFRFTLSPTPGSSTCEDRPGRPDPETLTVP